MSDVETQSEAPAEVQAESTPTPRVPAPPIESRFLFVDIAALRAKQLRRGAKCRLADDDAAAPPAALPAPPAPKKFKAERVAMEEVREGLVEWQLPDFKAVFDTR
jgi:DNA-directed RNA polymerase subunit K/omega